MIGKVLDTEGADRVHLVTTRSLPYTSTSAPDAPADLPSPAEILGRVGRENFTVASALLPAAARRHLIAFYGYARLVDQLGDAYGGDRRAALDWVEAETRAALADPCGRHPLVAGAAEAVTGLGADPAPLFDLVEANRRDQEIGTYRCFDDLVGYCRLSANPVGRLVLAAFERATPERVGWSDAICTGLQIAEHCQDVREDAVAGRVYLPVEDLERFGVDPATFRHAAPANPATKALLAFQVARARRWLDDGRPLIASLDGRLRWAVAGFWAGGHAALDAIANQDFDVLASPERLHPTRAGLARRLLQGIGGAGSGGRR